LVQFVEWPSRARLGSRVFASALEPDEPYTGAARAVGLRERLRAMLVASLNEEVVP
jgi:hypothetical protein